MHTGADIAAASDWSALHGTRFGVFSNPTGILADARHIVDDMVRHSSLDLVALFGPEHGFRGSAQAGFSESDGTDPRTGLPVYDAYHAGESELAEMFVKADLQTIVFDIQDVGVRYYTYIWSLYRVLAAAAQAGVRVVVLDRPNPIGRRVDGAMMRPGFTSGVGLKEIVQQHGMTIGELAGFYNGEFLSGSVELLVVRGASSVVPIWVPPSPNLPTLDSALAYAGTGLFEGTNLSEGRGTTRPFEIVGAPFLDHTWAERLTAYGLPGVLFREMSFVPTFHKFDGETCAGVQVHIVDPAAYEPIPTAVAMLVEAARFDGFAWREDDYDEKRPYWIDKLSGSPRLREMVDAGASLAEITGAWSGEVADFEQRRESYLLYQ